MGGGLELHELDDDRSGDMLTLVNIVLLGLFWLLDDKTELQLLAISVESLLDRFSFTVLTITGLI